MSGADWLSLFVHFALLSCIAIGGLTAVAPDMHRYVVDERHFMTSEAFATSYTLGSVVPGPNLLFVSFLGWRIGGVAGAFATTAAVLLPSTLIAIAAYRSAERWRDHPLVRAIRAGLAPIAVALTLATGWLLAGANDVRWTSALVTLATVAIVMGTRLNPLWLIAVGAALGAAGAV